MATNFSDKGNSPTFSVQAEAKNFNVSDMENLEERTNIDYDNCFRMNTSASKPIISVARRNERERKRVRLVNQGFAILRDRVPRDRCSRGRRSSKVETLRAAIMYIRQLQQLLLENQMRYQEQDMPSCYNYIGDDSCQNSPVPSVCDNYLFNNGYQQEMFQTSSYPHLRSSGNTQYGNQVYDRHLAVPWFT